MNLLRRIFKINRPLAIFINQPLVSKKIILTNYYEELQRNNWADIIEDDTKDLAKLVRHRACPKPLT